MTDIKERAEEYAKNQLWGIALEDDEYEQRYNSIVEVYIEIASEQKEHDIKNALSFLRIYGEGDFSCFEEFEAKFRKAMGD